MSLFLKVLDEERARLSRGDTWDLKGIIFPPSAAPISLHHEGAILLGRATGGDTSLKVSASSVDLTDASFKKLTLEGGRLDTLNADRISVQGDLVFDETSIGNVHIGTITVAKLALTASHIANIEIHCEAVPRVEAVICRIGSVRLTGRLREFMVHKSKIKSLSMRAEVSASVRLDESTFGVAVLDPLGGVLQARDCEILELDMQGATIGGASEFVNTRARDWTFAGAILKGPLELADITWVPDYLVGWNAAPPSPQTEEPELGVSFYRLQLETDGRVSLVGERSAFDMAHVSLLFVDVSRFQFVREVWPRIGNRRVCIEEVLLRERLDADAPTQFAPEHVADLYRGLRTNYELAGRFSAGGDFFVGEMEMELLQTAPKRGLLASIRRHLTMLGTYKLLSNFGQDYRRAILWCAASIVLFAAVRIGHGAPVPDALTDSVGAFFSVNAEAAVDKWQRVVSLALLALVVLALRQRFMRRSSASE